MDNSDIEESRLRHVAIIMDGNNRWAKREGKQGIAGHKAGVERIRDVLAACRAQGVEALTLFAFSSENWRRPPIEVEALMGLFYSYLKKEARKLAEEGVALRVIGNRSRFSKSLLRAIDEAESTASDGDATLVIAADYGGCWDIANSARQLAEAAVRGDITPDQIDEQALSNHIQTAGLPPLDLLIRTGGELRISNFLLWQAAYAELYFSDLLWPDFGKDALDEAVADFHRRQRRFGKTSDQLKQEAARA
ncbi:polyprenyl diphosphate synthase [Saccharophagus degradans]|uniref:Ditrans,polycis-undecaprenyl-diphosphate synthase ((2E,6E)-farnesyl-diphosphate specific) n=1 Tax=Saccharophagus degradans TaxID=86304 RepID=A0AAW7XCG5_9GAMM|nr:polyprenyl diphosphate synthase [Saccharophagus degradans]MDO6424651.1 polyprenyl diphosphate synthase [Saccharophagus degradans]MDO6608984.1 polyprenyl diphosphate synthase [Saccharophagus degradans]